MSISEERFNKQYHRGFSRLVKHYHDKLTPEQIERAAIAYAEYCSIMSVGAAWRTVKEEWKLIKKQPYNMDNTEKFSYLVQSFKEYEQAKQHLHWLIRVHIGPAVGTGDYLVFVNETPYHVHVVPAPKNENRDSEIDVTELNTEHVTMGPQFKYSMDGKPLAVYKYGPLGDDKVYVLQEVTND